jgi:hypothetical protein
MDNQTGNFEQQAVTNLLVTSPDCHSARKDESGNEDRKNKMVGRKDVVLGVCNAVVTESDTLVRQESADRVKTL